MPLFTALRTPMALCMTVFPYVLFIMSIVTVTKTKSIYGKSSYPKPSVALIVSGCLQMLFMVLYWMRNKMSLMSGRNVMAATGFFAAFTFGAAVALTVRRHHYCPAGGVNVVNYPGGAQADCAGVIRGQMAMAWLTFGWSLLYIGFIMGLTRVTQSMSAVPVGKMGYKERDPDEKV